MKIVNRRPLLLIGFLLFALASTACIGGETTALSVGDQSLSREGLNDLMYTLQGDDPRADDLPAQLAANAVRDTGSAWLRVAAMAEFASQQGIVMSDADEAEARTIIEDAISSGQIGNVPQSSEAYDALILSVWTGSDAIATAIADPDAQEVLAGIVDDIDVDSRYGVFDPVLGQIVANPSGTP